MNSLNFLESYKQFHDAELVGVQIARQKEFLRLVFASTDEREMAVNFMDVDLFRITDLQVQNVVSRLHISNVHNFSEKELFHWVTWVSTTSEGTPLINTDAVTRYVEDIRSGERVLFVLEPSWGAECAVISRALSSHE